MIVGLRMQLSEPQAFSFERDLEIVRWQPIWLSDSSSSW
jgi:hypothetical protein